MRSVVDRNVVMLRMPVVFGGIACGRTFTVTLKFCVLQFKLSHRLIRHLVPTDCLFLSVPLCMGHAVAQWLRCCATNRKVAGSIPAGVSGFFIDITSFRSHYGPVVDSASNRNEYQEYFLGVKAAGL